MMPFRRPMTALAIAVAIGTGTVAAASAGDRANGVSTPTPRCQQPDGRKTIVPQSDVAEIVELLLGLELLEEFRIARDSRPQCADAG